MQSLQFDPVLLTGTLFLFAIVAIGMLLAPLLIGYLLRPHQPNAEKEAIYECGEPTIGTSNVQFDLRFYVVALLFIVFDVEVAFFFPWAVVFGKANTLAKSEYRLSDEQRQEVSNALLSQANAPLVESDSARMFLRIAMVDMLAFFGVVLVGFAYVWRRGDLDWVRSVARQRAMEMHQAPRPPPA